MAARGIFSLLSLILVAGGLLLSLFMFLAGGIDSNPINKFYFLQADTSNIPGAPQLARWTFWNICEGASGRNVCGNTGYGQVALARPFQPPASSNFDTTTNIPGQFIGNRTYYYLSKTFFAFSLVSTFFAALALLTGVLALCTRLGAYFSGLLTGLAAFFQALTAALMTSAFVMGRNAFRSNGQAATIGQYAFGFEWAAFACWFLASIFFCMGGSSKKDTYGSSKGGFFKGRRSASTRSRGSFIKADKEYA